MFAYDDYGRLEEINAGSGLVHLAYEYVPKENNIEKIFFHHRGPTVYNQYGYDDIDRLTAAAYHNSDTEGFVMDDLGNRDGNQTLRQEGTVHFAVDTLTNRYTAVAGNPLAYDDAGNLTQDKDGYRYVFDYENRITRIFKLDGQTEIDVAGYAYDALGRRICKTSYDSVPSVATLYYYSDNWQVLSTYVGGSLDKSFVFGNYIDEVLVMNQGANDYFYLHDHLYSPAALLDNTGSVVERYEYDAYGSCRILDSNSDIRISSLYGNPYAFTGRELDTLDAGSCTLMHYRHRAYDPEIGRFMQRDPMGTQPVSNSKINLFKPIVQYQDGMNLYDYVNNNPIKYMDYSGMFTIGKRSHDKVTKKAFDEAMSNTKLTSPCKNTILKSLIKANTGQDRGAAFKDLRRHCNRDRSTLEDDANKEYDEYLSEETQNIAVAKRDGDCQKELDAMGRLEHSLQDFFAHAVGPHGNTEIWSRGSNKLDPYHRGNTHPSSYPGEHPAAREPGSEEEQQARFDAAVLFMTHWYKNNYSDFLDRCVCELCK